MHFYAPYFKTGTLQDQEEAKLNGSAIGYYLVLPDGRRFFISKVVDLDSLERLCDLHCTSETRWNYWIDYSYGLDTDGEVQWGNVDKTARFC